MRVSAELDHLVVAADSLQRGADYVQRCLGVRCQPGGRHPGMNTHNALVRLGATTYLEIIAIESDAQAASMPRWFGLDDAAIQRRLRARPRLLTWVARTADLESTLAGATYDPGTARPMRRGDLAWQIAFPEDGHLIEGGLVPTLIQWGADTSHPSSNLPADGVELVRLHASHPEPARVLAALASLGIDDALEIVEAPEASLRAKIRTRHGQCWLA